MHCLNTLDNNYARDVEGHSGVHAFVAGKSKESGRTSTGFFMHFAEFVQPLDLDGPGYYAKWYCQFRWDGERWRGGNVRARVVKLCRAKFDADGSRKLGDSQVLGKACDGSSMLRGLFTLLDMEIRIAVEPFVLWEEGDLRPFLRALPSMCALIALGYQPQVRHALTGLGCGSFGCGC